MGVEFFLKFSTRTRYGLRAMIELALSYKSKRLVSLNEIAQSQDISHAYLEQLIVPLRKGGLVRSVRGAQGGYCLSREPSQITAGEIIQCLDGPIAPTDCVCLEVPIACNRDRICASKSLWEKIRCSIVKILDETTLEHLADEAFAKEGDRNICNHLFKE